MRARQFQYQMAFGEWGLRLLFTSRVRLWLGVGRGRSDMEVLFPHAVQDQLRPHAAARCSKPRLAFQDAKPSTIRPLSALSDTLGG